MLPQHQVLFWNTTSVSFSPTRHSIGHFGDNLYEEWHLTHKKPVPVISKTSGGRKVIQLRSGKRQIKRCRKEGGWRKDPRSNPTTGNCVHHDRRREMTRRPVLHGKEDKYRDKMSNTKWRWWMWTAAWCRWTNSLTQFYWYHKDEMWWAIQLCNQQLLIL